MTQTQREDNMFHKRITDDDWENETDITILINMLFQWKMIDKKWSNQAEIKLRYLESCDLTLKQKAMLEQIKMF